MLTFGLTAHERFSLAKLDGLVSLEGWEALLRELAARMASSPAHAQSRLVLDMTAAVGYLGVPERRAVGALMAQYFAANVEKFAIVVQPEKITDVVRNEARKNGLNLKLFSEHEDAVAWVTS